MNLFGVPNLRWIFGAASEKAVVESFCLNAWICFLLQPESQFGYPLRAIYLLQQFPEHFRTP